MTRLLACAAAILALSQAAPASKPTAAMRADVDRLVARATELSSLWPWKAAYPATASPPPLVHDVYGTMLLR